MIIGLKGIKGENNLLILTICDGKRRSMDLTTLGATNLLVSRIGIGLAALGRPGYINIEHANDLEQNYAVAAMEARAHAVLDAAYEGGVRYFDAARSYGRAEEFLGNWLRIRGLSPKNVVVGSKWGYTYTADWKTDAKVHEVKDHSLDVLQRQWNESQEHLGLYLNLYQIHSASFESGVLKNTAVLNEMARLKSKGIPMGLTVSGDRQSEVIELSLELKVDGVRLFDCVQATWNLLEKSAGPALAKASDLGIGVIAKEALANGRLTNRNKDPFLADKMKVLKREAQRLSTTVDGLALAAVLAQPWIDVVLSGAASIEHLKSNLSAVEVMWDGQAASELDGIAESASEYWATRGRLKWN
jgi:aryl-alcohol dehydrogenase-like predicted oxidoreductase